MSPAVGEPPTPTSARHFFGAELRLLRRSRALSQAQLAARVVHSRALIAAVELGERWPPRDLAVRCDEALATGGALGRLWPLVDAERKAAREVLAGTRLADLREMVLRLAALTGADLSALTAAALERATEEPDRRPNGPLPGEPARPVGLPVAGGSDPRSRDAGRAALAGFDTRRPSLPNTVRVPRQRTAIVRHITL